MERPDLQMTVATMLGLVACIAVNFWLFRLGVFWGILGLNVTKHVAIAYLCQVLGVDRARPAGSATRRVMVAQARAPIPCGRVAVTHATRIDPGQLSTATAGAKDAAARSSTLHWIGRIPAASSEEWRRPWMENEQGSSYWSRTNISFAV